MRRGEPSAGSIYPTLQMLEDGGYVTSAQVGSKKVYPITEEGTELLGERSSDREPVEVELSTEHRMHMALARLQAAAMSARDPDDAVLDNIRAVIDKERKGICGVLAADDS